MCGIIGCIGQHKARPTLLEGLSAMEYRGYDSAGMALYDENAESSFVLKRAVGRVENLKKIVENLPQDFFQGIAHTRWATHGVPSEANAHPHQASELVLVHNGIIENHASIKSSLQSQGVNFESQTDTEVFAKLINSLFLENKKQLEGESSSEDIKKVLFDSMREAASQVEGHYAVLFMMRTMPGSLFMIQSGAPLVLGFSDKGAVVASDLQAVLPHTSKVSFLPVNSMAELCEGTLSLQDMDSGDKLDASFETIQWSAEKVAKDGFDHYMLKEIYQQPSVIADTLSGRMPTSEFGAFAWDNLVAHEALWKNVRKLYLVACGTAYHAALVAKYYFEKWAKISVEVDIASEFRYRSPLFDPGTVVGVISQSGETADTLAALRLANANRVTTFSVCNVPGSTIMRESNFQYSTKAGPEIGVASTKAFTAQVTVLCAMAIDVARIRGMSPGHQEFVEGYNSLARLPQDFEKLLQKADEYRHLGAELKDKKTILFVGRGTMYPIALEGALKLKEITYRHAEGYAAGELKHGPIALVDSDLAAIVLAPKDELRAKTLSNLEEIKSRGAYVIGIGEGDDKDFRNLCDRYVAMPSSTWTSAPILYVLPTQLISYGLALELDCDIDKPRNLAKSVTVE